MIRRKRVRKNLERLGNMALALALLGGLASAGALLAWALSVEDAAHDYPISAIEDARIRRSRPDVW